MGLFKNGEPDGITAVLTEIAIERRRQDKKWGPQEHTPHYWLAILLEEAGEAAAETGYITAKRVISKMTGQPRRNERST